MKLSALVESVKTTDEEIVITKNGFPAAVLVSPEEFDGWRETLAIHEDSDLLNDIKEGLLQLKEDRAELYTLDELFGK